MKRRHSRNDAIDFAAGAAAAPDIAFGADIIAGFPTGGTEMFAAPKRWWRNAALTFLHVFPYSPRPGTPARGCRSCGTCDQRARAAIARAGEAALQRRLAQKSVRRARS